MRLNIECVVKYNIYCFVFCVGAFARKKEAKSLMIHITKDILFVNGCDVNELPHHFLYRVLHQMEQLNSVFFESDIYDYITFEPNITDNCGVVIFYRCPWNYRVNESIELSRELNKKVSFDIDDLVIDKKYTELIPLVKAIVIYRSINYII